MLCILGESVLALFGQKHHCNPLWKHIKHLNHMYDPRIDLFPYKKTLKRKKRGKAWGTASTFHKFLKIIYKSATVISVISSLCDKLTISSPISSFDIIIWVANSDSTYLMWKLFLLLEKTEVKQELDF